MKLLVELRYIGTNYHGWQAQDNAASVQKTVQNAAETMLSAACRVTGCSRTDAGVHAKQYFCTVESDALENFPVCGFPAALNSFLPEDISAVSAKRVDDGFHPRYNALAKEYEYLFFVGAQRDAFYAHRAYMLPGRRPDAGIMQAEAETLVGTHDFSSFCAAGGKIEEKVRTVYYCKIEEDEELIRLKICADGFLYNMVRIIAGTLYECGIKKKENCCLILKKKERAFAGRTAPPDGLYLKRVFYDKEELEKAVKNGRSD